jgi:hypothetical protein
MDQQGINLIIGGVFTVLWFLLRQKDANQAKQIELLFAKHDADAARLDDLKLEIAQKHYIKNELDAKFEKMEATFERGFRDMGGKFDRLSEVLINRTESKQ